MKENILKFSRKDLQFHNQGLTVRAGKGDDKKAEIVIYDTITPYADEFWGGISAKMIDKEIKNLAPDTKELLVRINSPGGSVFEGMTIYNRFLQLREKMTVNVIVDGLAASIASIIAMCGEEIIMANESFMMIHKPWTYTAGNAVKHDENIRLLDSLEYAMINVYKKRCGMDRNQIAQMLMEETWMHTDVAISKGFATKKADADTEVQVAASALASEWFSKAPKIENTAEKFLAQKKRTDISNHKKRIGECLARG